jgi:choloylglycine hydrolase
MKRPAVAFCVILFCLCSSSPVFPCTTFVLEGGHRVYVGHNLDWDWEDGLVLINPRHVCKRAFVAAENVATWTSKYGSVTFNQFGRELPFGGMNEAGLVVENMWLSDTQYPPVDARPEINMLQWIQYQLDNCSTVAQVIRTDKRIRLENTPVRARIHYLVCDAHGDCATVEFLNGTMQVHRGRKLPFHALANDTYEQSATYMRAHPTCKDTSQPLTQADSMARFCRAAARAAAFRPAKSAGEDAAYAFETLDQVRQGTAWQIVYNISARQIQFRTRGNPQTRLLNLKTLEFSCNRPVRFVDVQAKASDSGGLELRELQEPEHRKYLEHIAAQESLMQEVGDLRSMIEPLLLTLRGYTCADNKIRAP